MEKAASADAQTLVKTIGAITILSTVARGFCMGAADVVPGVSGGTMAVVLGIYKRLIDAIRAFDTELIGLISRAQIKRAARHVDAVFIAPLAVGVAAALIFFTRVIPLPELIRTHPVPIYSLFFGLITASVIVLLKTFKGFHTGDAGALLVGVLLGFGIVNLVPTATPESAWFVFLSGALAICAMILPGISGSFILLILQKYTYVFGAIGRLDFSVLLPFALGAVTGLLLFSRLLGYMLEHFYRVSVNCIVGLLIGSLWVIWPFQQRVELIIDGTPRVLRSTPYLPPTLDAEVLAAGLLAGVGVAAVLALHHLASARGQAGGL